MSYILDALKKIEQKRRQEGTLTLLTSQGQLPVKAKPRRIWLYIISAALVLNAGALFWWVGPWRQPAKNSVQKAPALREAKPPTQPVAGAGVRMETEYVGEVRTTSPTKDTKETARHEVPKESREPSPPAAKPVAASSRAPGVAETPSKTQKPQTAQKPAPVEQAYSEPSQPSEPKPPRDGRVHKIADLPASVSARVPELKMSLHYFIADPKARFARINDKTLREGESLAEGLKVDEINAGGVVMNYRGWRFLLGISNEK